MWHSHLRVIASAITADRGPLALVLRARDKEFRVHGGKRLILEVVKTRPIRASVAHLARVACRSGRCRATCARISRISTSGQSLSKTRYTSGKTGGGRAFFASLTRRPLIL